MLRPVRLLNLNSDRSGRGPVLRRTLGALLVTGALGLSGALVMSDAMAQSSTGDAAQSGLTNVTLTLDEMRQLGVEAIRAGDFANAIRIGEALIARDPQDPYGHFLVAQARLRSGDASAARKAARTALRTAKTDTQRHEAARVIAASHASEGQFFLAQVWMRKALQDAPHDIATARAAQEFRLSRNEAKLGVSAALSFAPSSNLNGGSSEELLSIDGLPILDGGRLSGSALALSGTEAKAALRLDYRLHRSDRSETVLRAGATLRRVWLSEAAQDRAPNVENEDLATHSLELGLLHARAVGDSGTRLQFELAAGRNWQAGTASSDYLRGSASLTQPLSAATRLSLGVTAQMQRDAVSTVFDADTLGFHAGLFHSGDAGRVRLIWQAGKTRSDNTQQERDYHGFRLGYAPAKPVGPVALDFEIAAMKLHYPDYRVLFAVPGGRQDTRLTGRVDMTFHQLDYMGFVPTVGLVAERVESNISRFDVEQMSVEFGFRSRF